jgi:hypothetical protein
MCTSIHSQSDVLTLNVFLVCSTTSLTKTTTAATALPQPLHGHTTMHAEIYVIIARACDIYVCIHCNNLCGQCSTHGSTVSLVSTVDQYCWWCSRCAEHAL